LPPMPNMLPISAPGSVPSGPNRLPIRAPNSMVGPFVVIFPLTMVLLPTYLETKLPIAPASQLPEFGGVISAPDYVGSDPGDKLRTKDTRAAELRQPLGRPTAYLGSSGKQRLPQCPRK